MQPIATSPHVQDLIDRVGVIVYEATAGDGPRGAEFTFVSAGARILLGYEPERWREPGFWLELIEPEDREAVLAATSRAIAAGTTVELEYRMRTSGGENRWVRNVMQADRTPGDVVRVSGVVSDTSRSHRAEDRLERLHLATMRLSARTTQEETAQVIAAVGHDVVGAAGIAVFVLDGDELAALSQRGQPGGEVPAGCRLPLQADLPVAQAARERRPVVLDAAQARACLPATVRLLAGDGALAALPLTAADGALIGVLGIRLRDATEIVPADRTLLEILARAAGAALGRVAVLDAERAARRRAEDATLLLDTVFSSAPEGFALYDLDGRYRRVNQALADMNGVPVQEHLGRTPADVVPGIPADHLIEEVRRSGRALVDLELDGPNALGERSVRLASFYPVHGADGALAWVGAFVVDITRRKRNERRFVQLAELGAILEAAGDVEERLTRVADALTGEFADFTTIYLRRPGDRLDRVVTRHVDPGHEALIATNPPSRGTILLSGPQRFDDMSLNDYEVLGADPVARDRHRTINTRSIVTTPLLLRGETLGVIAIGSVRAAAFDAEDEQFLVEIATRAALAVENARLYDAERRARGRTENQYAIAAALADALTPSDVGRALLGELLPALDADAGLVLRVDESGTRAEPIGFAGAGAGPGGDVVLSPDLPLTRAVHDRRASWTGDASVLERVWPGAAAMGLAAAGIVPLLSAGRPVGALIVLTRRPAFGAEDHALTMTAAVQAGQALERATLFESTRRTSVTLQRSLLPPRLPEPPGAQVGLRYLPAAGLEAGGDFYEALPVGDDGTVMFAVGDVVGRGATAAAAMGQLRSALRAFSQVLHRPGAVLRRLSDFALEVDGAMAATAVVGTLLPATGELRYACAGHPWPLLVRADGSAEYLRDGRGVPLGCVPDPGYQAATARLAPGETLLLYTDGLSEKRGTALPVAMERLRAAAAQASGLPLDGLLDAVVSAMVGDDAGDDVALLGVRLALAPTDRHLSFPADLREVPHARALVRTWLGELGVRGADADDVLLAAGEAFANAVEHSGAGEVRLGLTTPTPGTVAVDVEDSGTWRRPPEITDRGRGLGMMRDLVDEFAVDTGSGGTRVRMRHAVTGGAAEAPRSGADTCRVTLLDDVARLRGALDMASAATVGARLQARAADGLVIDLTDLDFLDSTGARLLLELSSAGAVRIVAPPRGIARRTLELSGLDGLLPLLDAPP